MLSLPSNLRRTYLYQDKPINLDNWTVMTVEWHNRLVVETKDGKLRPENNEQLFKFLSQYSVIFVYLPPGKLDILLSLCSLEELMALSLFNEVEVDGFRLRRYRDSIIVQTTPIYNIISLTKYYGKDNIDAIHKTACDIISSRQKLMGLYSLNSGASEARAWMLQDKAIFDDIMLSRKLKLDNIDKFNSACFGGRMESSGIGTQFQYHYDLIKAHLNILKDYPGLRNVQWIRGGHNYRNFDSALPHSIYQIIADVPEDRYMFYPLPIKTDAGIKYPPGKIKAKWYFKEYLELLVDLGISFKIIDSIQFFGEPEYPFRNYMNYVEVCIKYMKSEYPMLETKHLYATVAGSMKAIFRSLSKELAEVQMASRCFNPVAYGFILTRQNIKVYRDALKTGATSLKVDAIATPNKSNVDDSYKLKCQGPTSYLTPALKTLPNGQKILYRQAMSRYEDSPFITVQFSAWRSLESFTSDVLLTEDELEELDHDVGLGHKFTRYLTLHPTYGNRQGPQIERVGQLLDNWYESNPNNSVAESDSFNIMLESRLNFSEKFNSGG